MLTEHGMYASVQAASLLGGFVGPALGGLLADMSGLRAPFTLTGCAALLAAIYGAIRLPETMGTRQQEPFGASTGASKEETMVSCQNTLRPPRSALLSCILVQQR